MAALRVVFLDDCMPLHAAIAHNLPLGVPITENRNPRKMRICWLRRNINRMHMSGKSRKQHKNTCESFSAKILIFSVQAKQFIVLILLPRNMKRTKKCQVTRFHIQLIQLRLSSTSFPGLSCEDEGRDEKALVWAGQFCILIG
jgi:hypothetical protein